MVHQLLKVLFGKGFVMLFPKKIMITYFENSSKMLHHEMVG